METNQNYVELWGIVESVPVFSHENHGQSYYKFPLRVERLSGQSDYPVVVVSDAMLASFTITQGLPLRVTGQLRSFNNKSGEGNRLILTVFAQTLEVGDGSFFNRILLSGTLCKLPTLRRTPLGRSICDMILAVNRHYGRADYLPCIAWGQLALQLTDSKVGDRLHLEGRVQSRNYVKLLDSGPEHRTAYEVSIMQLLENEDSELL